jgi:cation/acetate symporter
MVGTPVPQLGLGGDLSNGNSLLHTLDQLSTDLGFQEYTTSKKSFTDLFFVTAALMLGTAGLPHVIVRFFTVPKVSDARKSAGWALLFIAILYTTAPAIAVFARTNLLNSVNQISYDELPGWFNNWEQTGLLKYEDKNGDGKVQYYNDQNETFNQVVAHPNGWRGNELFVDQDIMVLANPEIAQLPDWVIALVVAGGLAAALSTAAGLLLVISSSISHDFLKRWLRPDITEKQELLSARIAIAAAVIIAGYAGLKPPGFVAQVVAFAFGLAAASFFPAIVMGIFSKRMNMQGAISGMIAGLVFTASYILYFKYLGGTPDQYLWGISPEGIGTLGMIVNFVVSFSVALVTPKPPQKVIDMIEEIRIPRGAGQSIEH